MDKKKIIVIGVIGLVFVVLSIFVYYFAKYDTIICNSLDGAIILIYDKENLVNFGTTGKMAYDFDNQKSYVEKLGIKKYIKAFKYNYINNLSGKCKELK